jgi:transcriptional regulator with XRE-family HTH domain
VLVEQTEEHEIDEQVRMFGENMRGARHGAGLSQVELSSASRVDRAAISFLERAKRSPDLQTLLRTARALGVEPADLVRGIGPESSHARAPREDAPGDPAGCFGATLKWARDRAKLSQEALALQANVDRAAISIYEHGRREPNLRTILKLARALELPPATLLRGVK